MPITEVKAYEVSCDTCGEGYEDGDGATMWGIDVDAWDAVTGDNWFAPSITVTRPDGTRFVKPRIVLCPKCQPCEVCGAPGYVNGDERLVCREHEAHEFPEARNG